jgi:branched-chain amino acid transport system ATP-binding protein
VKPLLEVKDLSVSYGAIQALKKVSLKVFAGETISLVGANGAGKSTLMKTIIGINKVQSGDIQFRSFSMIGLKSHEIIRLGISQSPEGRQVFSDMSVYENLLMGTYSKQMTSVQVKDRMEEIFSLFPILKARIRQFAMTLSGGEQQMLAIGRALMLSPDLLLLDEPSLGISPLLTEKIFEILVGLNRTGTSILLAEQNAAMALEISQRGYVLEVGEVIYEDTAEKLMANDMIRKAYLGV